MRRELELLADELRALRAEGETGVYLTDATRAALHQAVATRRGSAPSAPKVPSDPRAATSETAPAAGSAPSAETVPTNKAPRPNRYAEEAAPTPIPMEAIQLDTGPKKRAAKKAAADPAVAQGLPAGCEPIPEPEPFTIPEGDKQTRWSWLREKVLSDPVCNAHLRPDDRVVFGVGNIEAELFFCGEAPGEQEARQGEPFVGPAGQKLDQIIKAMGLGRERVYIGNICNWRPEHTSPKGNRKPVAAEMAYCLPFLLGQLEIVRPKVIVALGKTATEGLLGPNAPKSIMKARGTWAEFNGTPVMLTLHPSYLLHNDSREVKRQVWEDMLAVMERLGLSISDKQRGFFAAG